VARYRASVNSLDAESLCVYAPKLLFAFAFFGTTLGGLFGDQLYSHFHCHVLWFNVLGQSCVDFTEFDICAIASVHHIDGAAIGWVFTEFL